MARLTDVTVEDLQQALEAVEGKKPTMRLTAAIAYKNGVSQTELAEWYDVQRRTIYGWLKRLEEEPLEEAAQDDRRSGRPRKLSDAQRAQLEATLHEPPSEAGYDAPAWTPSLVQTYLDERFGVTYSRPSCRRLMKEAGLRYRKTSDAVADDGDTGGENPGSRGWRWVPQ